MSSLADTPNIQRRPRSQRHDNFGVTVLTRTSTVSSSPAKMEDAATINAIMIVNDTSQELIEKIKQREVVYIDEHQYMDKREKVWKNVARQHGVTNSNYIISNYKTIPCERPARLCRKAYLCPQYHNNKDKRRNPKKYTYRTTACANVKRGDEWGEPSDCRSGDSCYYCHTKTEQQFHPQIYKSLKCNDMQQTGCCPRGFFCSFAHFDYEICNINHKSTIALDSSTDLADMLSNALPSIGTESLEYPIRKINDDKNSLSNESGDLSECTSSIGSYNKAPKTHLSGSNVNVQQFQIANADTLQDFLHPIDSHSLLPNVEPQKKYNSLFEYPVINGNNNSLYLDYLTSHQPVTTTNGNLGQRINQENECSMFNNILSSSLKASDNMFRSSAPANIPITSYNDIDDFYDWSKSSPLKQMQNNIIQKPMYNQKDDLVPLNIVTDNKNDTNNLFDNGSSETAKIIPMYPSNSNEVQRLQEDLLYYRSKLVHWDSERTAQVKFTYEAWKKETEDLNIKLKIVEQERDEVINHSKLLQEEINLLQVSPYLHGISKISEIGNLSLSVLKSLQNQMRNDLEEIEKALYLQTATKCMLCEERNRSVTLGPCNHFVLCKPCINIIKDCPYCSTPILSYTNTSTSLE